MEKLITMGLDSKSFQDLVIVCSYMENSLCPQTSAQPLLLLLSQLCDQDEVIII